jgi:hypothetical protein
MGLLLLGRSTSPPVRLGRAKENTAMNSSNGCSFPILAISREIFGTSKVK